MFNTTIVYQKTAEAAGSPEIRYIVNQGGTSSGKTYAIVQLLFNLAMSEPDTVITIAGQDVPNLKKGAFRDAETIYRNTPALQAWFAKPILTDRIFKCRNGSILEFASFSDEQDAKSGKRHYLFVNEANGVPFNIYWQLQLRTAKKVFIDYNPTSRFWVHNELLGKPNVKLIISDHRHNSFLSDEMHNLIESEADEEKFRVYARGKTGKLDELIYHNWVLTDELPKTTKRWYGLDFGFTNSPTALVEVVLNQGELWLRELCYNTRMNNKDIFNIIQMIGIEREVIVADSNEQKTIEELRSLGCVKIEPAKKGRDSVKNGIDILQRYKLNVDRKSINLITELGSYKWKKTKDGILINEPEKEFDHLLDGLRYVALRYLKVRRTTTGGVAKLLKPN